MAVPYLRTALDCVDFDKTVLPYIYQFYDLPEKALTVLQGKQSPLSFYTTTNPLVFGFALSLFLAPIFLVVSEYHRNYSWVDRFWSILPTVYNTHYALYAHLTSIPTGRSDLVFLASAIWSTRLTFNYWRRGGYSRGSEDYRWEILQKTIKPHVVWFLFNVTFISTIQNILLFVVTVPSYVLLISSKVTQTPDTIDYIFASAMVGFVALTATADQQQQNYYNARDKYRKNKTVTPGYEVEDLERGFNTKGLFAYSRHPNFAFEQSVWLTLFFWASSVAGTHLSWITVGPVAYLLLFQASAAFSEGVTRSKYPDYQIFQKKVSYMVPMPAKEIDWVGERAKIAAKNAKKRA